MDNIESEAARARNLRLLLWPTHASPLTSHPSSKVNSQFSRSFSTLLTISLFCKTYTTASTSLSWFGNFSPFSTSRTRTEQRAHSISESSSKKDIKIKLKKFFLSRERSKRAQKEKISWIQICFSFFWIRNVWLVVCWKHDELLGSLSSQNGGWAMWTSSIVNVVVSDHLYEWMENFPFSPRSTHKYDNEADFSYIKYSVVFWLRQTFRFPFLSLSLHNMCGERDVRCVHVFKLTMNEMNEAKQNLVVAGREWTHPSFLVLRSFQCQRTQLSHWLFWQSRGKRFSFFMFWINDCCRRAAVAGEGDGAFIVGMMSFLWFELRLSTTTGWRFGFTMNARTTAAAGMSRVFKLKTAKDFNCSFAA